MKVTFIGTGTMSSIERGNTSVLVDDILFDIGMGIVKQLQRMKIYTITVKYICISHYHSDHFLDIPNLLIGKECRNEGKIVLIGAKGLRNKVIELMKFTHSDGNEHKYDKIEEKYNIEFVELEEGKIFQGDNFTITAVPLKHGTCKPVQGYILEKENRKLAYCCDMTLFDGFYDICNKVDYMFSDVNGLVTDDSHIGLEDYVKIAKKYNNCKFYAIHRGDYKLKYTDKVNFPMDGDVIEI